MWGGNTGLDTWKTSGGGHAGGAEAKRDGLRQRGTSQNEVCSIRLDWEDPAKPTSARAGNQKGVKLRKSGKKDAGRAKRAT